MAEKEGQQVPKKTLRVSIILLRFLVLSLLLHRQLMEDRQSRLRLSELVESDSREEEVEIEERRKEEVRNLVEVEAYLEKEQRWKEVQMMSEGRRRK